MAFCDSLKIEHSKQSVFLIQLNNECTEGKSAGG